jgi:diaminopimelate decarboxylase
VPFGELDPALQGALRTLGTVVDSPLSVGGLPAADLARRFGTPLYVFDANVLRARVERVRSTLGGDVRVLWSVKANPSLAVTSCQRAAGAGAEVASLGEMHLAIAAGHDAADLRFAGPGKTDREIDEAVGAGLGCFHAEAAGEIDAIASAAQRHGRRVPVAVRVNMPEPLRGARMRMGGHSSRFGIDEAQVPAVVRRIAADRSLLLRGLHVYAGTQSFDAGAFVEYASRLVTRALEWETQLGVHFDELDLGGGFGVPAYAGDPEFDLEAAGAGVREIVGAHPGRAWFVELGRYLCAPAGVYLCRVVRTKESAGELHAVLDGGLHQNAGAAGVGSVLRRPPLLVHAAAPDGAAERAAHVGGPLCTPADRFGEALPLPRIAEGDLIAVLHAGAYGLSYSPHSFLSHPTPAEVLVDGGEARVVRRRGEPRDVLRGQEP